MINFGGPTPSNVPFLIGSASNHGVVLVGRIFVIWPGLEDYFTCLVFHHPVDMAVAVVSLCLGSCKHGGPIITEVVATTLSRGGAGLFTHGT